MSDKRNEYIENDKKLIAALKELPADYWDFKDSDTHEYTHGIHSYPAMMVCPISRNLIRIMKDIMPIKSLLDPYAGSGTVLVEGILANIDYVTGNDINPLALLLAKVKTTPIEATVLRPSRSDLMERINQRYKEYQTLIDGVDDAMRGLGLDLTSKEGWGDNAPSYLIDYCKNNNIDLNVPDFKNLGYWFKPRVILLLELIKEEILKIYDEDIRDFAFVAFSEIIRLVSNRRNGEFKLFRMRPDKVETFEPDVIKEFEKILDRNTEKMVDFMEARKDSKSKVKICKSDAAELPEVEDNFYDIIITSPPYGDSRTTVAYGQYSRLSLQWIGLFDVSDEEIMSIDKSLMGGARFTKGFDNQLKSETLKKSLEIIRKQHAERAGDVYSFYKDLDKCIEAIAKKTRSGGYHFWVVGNRTVKNENLATDVIISELADQYGMDYVYTIDRNIVNKVMPSLNSPTNESGKKVTTMTNEHIVVLRKR